MDPEAALERARQAVRDYEAAPDHAAALAAADELVEAFQSLDGWLANGGLLPVSWWSG